MTDDMPPDFDDDHERLVFWIQFLAGSVIINHLWRYWMERQELSGIEQATFDREFWEQIHAEYGTGTTSP